MDETTPTSEASARTGGPPEEGGPQWFRTWAAIIVWFALWFLTPGLLAHGAGSLVTSDENTALLVETLLCAALLVPIAILHRRENGVLFARSRLAWAYLLPILAGLLLPLHYSLGAPLPLYMLWMAVSVLWQDYLTFGLLQRYLARSFPPVIVLLGTAVIFWAGHVAALPESFAPTHPLPSAAILALGLLMSFLRQKLGTLHLLLALHLGFYYILA